MSITQLRLAKVKDPEKLIKGLKEHSKEFNRKILQFLEVF